MAVPLAEMRTWSVVVVVVAAVANSGDEDVGSKVARRTLESCTNAETATSALCGRSFTICIHGPYGDANGDRREWVIYIK